jgi:hypothetical protein
MPDRTNEAGLAFFQTGFEDACGRAMLHKLRTAPRWA